MRHWIWRILLAAMVSAALAGTALAAEPIDWSVMEDENFQYEAIYVSGTDNSKANIKAYRVKKYIGDEREATIPDRFHGKPVTEIGVNTTALATPDEAALKNASVFADSKLDSKVSIPNSVTVINSGAFAYARVTEIVIPGSVETIETYAFANCSALVDIKLLDYADNEGNIHPGHTTIAAHAFEGCKYIKSLDIPNSVSTISDSAFKGCAGLIDLILPYSVNKVASGAFAECRNLLNVTVLGANVEFDKTSFEWRDVFKTQDAKPGAYFHCAYSDTITNIGKILDSLGIPGKEVGEYKARIHTVTVQSDGLSVSGRTEPLCRSTGTNGKVTLAFACTGYSVNVPVYNEDGSPATDADGKPVTKPEHRDCTCYNGKDSYSRTLDVSAVYHNEVAITEVVEATCSAEGRKDGTKCIICGEVLEPQEITPATGVHTYTAASETEERNLFAVRCDSPAGETGLTLVSKKCEVCGHMPSCFICEFLEMGLKDANAGLESVRQELADAAAKAEAAQKALEAAKAAKGAADADLTKAQEELDEAKKTLGELGADATQEEKDAAEKAVKAAELAKAKAELALEKAEKAVTDAQAAADAAEQKREEVQEKLDQDTTLSAAQAALRKHLEDGQKHEECAKCSELIKAIAAAQNDTEKAAAETAYAEHQADPDAHKPKDVSDAVSGKTIDVPEHEWGDPEFPETDADGKPIEVPECGSGEFKRVPLQHTCKVCQKTELTGEEEIREAAAEHKPPAGTGSTNVKEPSCTEEGLKVYDDYECTICHKLVKGGEEAILAKGHEWVSVGEVTVKEATCVEEGLKLIGTEECKRCKEKKDGEEVVIPRKGHDWGDPVSINEGKDDKAPTCGDPGTAYVTVTCSVCLAVEDQTIEIPATGQHEWGEWDRVKEPTAFEEGLQKRECSVCHQIDERAIPALGECEVHDYGAWETVKKPTATEDGLRKRVCKVCGHEDTEKIDATGGGTTTDPDAIDYAIECIQTTNGRISAPSSARRGATVSVSFSPDSGYELDQVRVTQAGGGIINTTGSGNRRTFTMPAGKVEIRATFSRIVSSFPDWSDSSSGASSHWTDPSQTAIQGVPRPGASQQLFYDVPIGHWAAGEISWANQMGYMNGDRWGAFDPDGTMTFQQMWMVLARVNGYWPSSMEDAKRWAVEGGFAEGANPTTAITRHQMVTALFRCARLMGNMNNNYASLAGYTDSRTVPASARNAMEWAVANGIIGGTSNGRLEPNQTITRAQFAVILYRFGQRV